ncbi:mRNA turnover protein 4 [Pancytospora philotis]|nr:mRNA turnover protein 4 [Pancytospora philotis]
MKVVAKKQKEKQRSDVDKIKELLAEYPVLHVVLNADIPNVSIQALRGAIEGKVLFVKKAIFQREYPSFSIGDNFFLIFAKENLSSTIEGMAYPDYLKEGESATERVVVPAGVVRSARVASLIGNTIKQGGNTVLLEEAVVCEEGAAVDEKQVQILKALGRRMGSSTLKVLDVKMASDLK